MDLHEKQKNALGKVWRAFKFNKSLMAKELGVSRQTVNHWFVTGRISPTYAIIACEHESVKALVTKEELRPDIKEWFGV